MPPSVSRPASLRPPWPSAWRGLPAGLLLLALGPGPAGAQVPVFHGAFTAGSSFRAADRDPLLVGPGNAAALGLPVVSTAGRNTDDGDLNFARGDRISTVLKGFLDAELKGEHLGAFLRIKAWQDFALQGERRPWGNLANGYAADQPLGDRSWEPRARARGLVPQEAFLSWRGAVGGRALEVRLGDQLIPWGSPLLLGSGLAVLNPLDLPALHRPGALPEETRVPVPALFFRRGLSSQVDLEGFWQVAWRPTVWDGGGTFYSPADYVAPGDDLVLLGPGSDRDALATGNGLRRVATPRVRDSGQVGLGLSWKGAEARLGLYAAQFHSRNPIATGFKTLRTSGPAFVAGDPGGLNPRYWTEFPEGLRLFGATFTAKLAGATLSGELVHQPNNALQRHSTDLLNAVASNTAPTLLRADMAALAPGALLPGSDRFATTALQLGATRPLPGWPELDLEAEAGLRRVHGLPDTTVLRYGRPATFPTLADPAQDRDGFISPFAWGYRLRMRLRGASPLPGVDLLPSLVLGQDLKGWSADGVFNEGRRTLQLNLRGRFPGQVSAELGYLGLQGGAYNSMRDRSVVSLSIGFRR